MVAISKLYRFYDKSFTCFYLYTIYLIIADTLQSILLISHCAMLSFYFSIVFALLLPHLAVTLLPTILLPFFALLLPIIPHLTVTIPPTIHLPF